jgi:hypothetical protein
VLGRVSNSTTDNHGLQALTTLSLVASLLLVVILSIASSCLYTATHCCWCWPGHCRHQAGSAGQGEQQHCSQTWPAGAHYLASSLVVNMLPAVMPSVALSCLYSAAHCCCCWPGHCLHQAGSARQRGQQHHDGRHSLQAFSAVVVVLLAMSPHAVVLSAAYVTDHPPLMSDQDMYLLLLRLTPLPARSSTSVSHRSCKLRATSVAAA